MSEESNWNRLTNRENPMAINTNNRYKMLSNSYNVDVIWLHLFVKHHLPNNRCENEIEYPSSIESRQNNRDKTKRLLYLCLSLGRRIDKLSPKNCKEMPVTQPLTSNNIIVRLDQTQMSSAFLYAVAVRPALMPLNVDSIYKKWKKSNEWSKKINLIAIFVNDGYSQMWKMFVFAPQWSD